MKLWGLAWVVAADRGIPGTAAVQQRQNYFDDPLVRVSSAVAGCPQYKTTKAP